MKIFFTPREVIYNRFNDELLVTDPNVRVKVPPNVRKVQVFNQTLHKLRKVTIPRNNFDKME